MGNFLSETTTRVLLDRISGNHGWALVLAVMAGFFLGAAVHELEYGAGVSRQMYVYLGFSVVTATMALAYRLSVTQRLMPELERRARELPPEAGPSGTDSSDQMKARKRLGRWGLAVFLLALPAGVLAALYDPASGEAAGMTLLSWAVVILFAAAGLVMMLRSVQCPSCSKLLQRRMSGELEFCPHCGTRLHPENG